MINPNTVFRHWGINRPLVPLCGTDNFDLPPFRLSLSACGGADLRPSSDRIYKMDRMFLPFLIERQKHPVHPHPVNSVQRLFFLCELCLPRLAPLAPLNPKLFNWGREACPGAFRPADRLSATASVWAGE